MTTHRWRRAIPMVAAALALVLAACAPAPETAESPRPSARASTAPGTVSLVDSSFGPDITVAVGTTVVFVNNGGLKHTASHGTTGSSPKAPCST